MAKKIAKKADADKDAEKAAKKKARMEALKNRPAGQRPNSKQIDVIDLGDGKVIKNYGYPIKAKGKHIGILVTSVSLSGDQVTGTSIQFIPGELTIKAKKGHGTITAPKEKKAKDAEETSDEGSED